MFKTLEFVTLDVFTDTPYRGNPLAIVLIPSKYEISDTNLQAIAREFNLSETVFLYLNEDGEQGQDTSRPSKVLEWRIRIFMTDCELPFAGHPTIGTAVYALTQLNKIEATRARLHCPAGTIEVEFDAASQTAKISIPHNVHLHTSNRYTASEIRVMQPGLTDDAHLKAFDVFSPVAGMNFLNVELSSLEALAAIAPTPLKPTLKLDEGWFAFGDNSTPDGATAGNPFIGTNYFAMANLSPGANNIASYYLWFFEWAVSLPFCHHCWC